MVWDKLTMCGGEWLGFPGPRDWSPALKRGMEELKEYLAIVPEDMRVSLEDVRKSDWQEIISIVEQGFAFIIKIGPENYHAVYVTPKGKIRMDQVVRKAIEGQS